MGGVHIDASRFFSLPSLPHCLPNKLPDAWTYNGLTALARKNPTNAPVSSDYPDRSATQEPK
jgi:hypothetical protein